MLLRVGVLRFDKPMTTLALFDFTWAFCEPKADARSKGSDLQTQGFKRTFFKSKIAQLILINSLNIA